MDSTAVLLDDTAVMVTLGRFTTLWILFQQCWGAGATMKWLLCPIMLNIHLTFLRKYKMFYNHPKR